MARRGRQSAAAAANGNTNGGGNEQEPAAPAPQTYRRRNNVAGPTSALTSFLREHGIQPTFRTNAYGQITPLNEAGPSNTHPIGEDPANVVTEPIVEGGPTEVGEGIPEYDDDVASSRGAKRKSVSKRNGRVDDDVDSDGLDDEGFIPNKKARSGASTGASTPTGSSALKNIGEFMNCAECTVKFTVTAYTRPHKLLPGYYCYECAIANGIDVFAKPKKPKAPAKKTKKEERGKVIHYEEILGPVGLGDMCIKLIGKYIEDVEALGNIGSKSMDKVCRIISKSRRLTPETAKLFYSGDRTELHMYDCTNLTPDSYHTLASLCPNLEEITLDLCGRLDTDGIIKWGKTLKHLRRMELEGPFNVRKEGWLKFIESQGKRLEGFLITESPRFDIDCLKALAKHCPNLKELRLKRFSKIDDEWLPVIAKFKKLETLDLSIPGHNSFTDEPVVDLLKAIGKGLEHLSLGCHIRLTDTTLLEGILKYCPYVRRLDLSYVADFAPPQEDEDYEKSGFTSEGYAEFLQKWKESGHEGLIEANFEYDHEMKSDALLALIKHSRETLERLNIKGWREVSEEALSQLQKCPELRELNLGWCRNVTDYVMKDILTECKEIGVVKVWGCNKLTDNVPRKKGCRVIGIESHAVA